MKINLKGLSNASLINSISFKYNINQDLVNLYFHSIGVEESINIFNMKPNDLNYTIRVNLLKTSVDECIIKLSKEGIIAVKHDIIPEALIIKSGRKKVGSSIAYLTGEIMPQGLGSMYTVHTLDPQPGEFILDMAAAPGGKSCFIGERMKNKGILIANEISRKRIDSLQNNITRHGINNILVTLNNAERIPNYKFDAILLDAPCSGDGLIVSKTNRKKSKSILNSFEMQKIQISLLKKALSLLKINGRVVYSTCSLSILENEEVIKCVKNQVELIKTNFQGYNVNYANYDEFSYINRLLPSANKCDGFTITKLRRIQ